MLKVFSQFANKLQRGESGFSDHTLGGVARSAEQSPWLVGVVAMICKSGFVRKFSSANCTCVLLMLKQAFYKFSGKASSVLSELRKFVGPVFRIVSDLVVSCLVVAGRFCLLMLLPTQLNSVRLAVIRTPTLLNLWPRLVFTNPGLFFFFNRRPAFAVVQKMCGPFVRRAFVFFLVGPLRNHMTQPSLSMKFA